MRWFRERPLASIVILLIILALLVAAAVRGNAFTAAAEGIVAGGLSPVQRFFSGITQGISNAMDELFGGGSLEKEHAALLKRVATLEMENQQFREQARENERLMKLLEMKSSFSTEQMTGARVISASPNYWQDNLIIDKGESEGIRKDMAVLVGEGLIGRVVETSAHTAKVMTLIDSQSAVSGIVERSRDNGVVKGLSVVGEESRLCRMEYLSLDADLVPGDRVLTSGLGGVYPKGLLIGEVMEVTTSAGETERYAIIKPMVDLAHVEEVLVITDALLLMSPETTDTPVATEEPES